MTIVRKMRDGVLGFATERTTMNINELLSMTDEQAKRYFDGLSGAQMKLVLAALARYHDSNECVKPIGAAMKLTGSPP